MIGLEKGKVKIVDFCDEWVNYFLLERKGLKSALKDNIIDIQHVGSTSIPNMPAKPIIDIGIAVNNFEEAKLIIKPVENLGYEYRGENGIPRRHFFVKRSSNSSKNLVHLHVNEISGKDWKNQIYLRDYLRKYPYWAKKYKNLKIDLANKNPEDRESYLEGKNDLIAEILILAYKEFE